MIIMVDYQIKLISSLWFQIGLGDSNIYIVKIIIFISKQVIRLLDKD
jgi:hypothetical protein